MDELRRCTCGHSGTFGGGEHGPSCALSARPTQPSGVTEAMRHTVETSGDVTSITVWEDSPERLHTIGDLLERVIAHLVPRGKIIRVRVLRDVAGPWARVIDFRHNVRSAAPTSGEVEARKGEHD